jgi:hypothetical protein
MFQPFAAVYTTTRSEWAAIPRGRLEAPYGHISDLKEHACSHGRMLLEFNCFDLSIGNAIKPIRPYYLISLVECFQFLNKITYFLSEFTFVFRTIPIVTENVKFN